MEYYNNVNIECPKESLCKRQFTMHLVFNSGTGDKYFVWCAIICNGTGKRITEEEKEIWDKYVDVFWQNKSWVDGFL